MDRELLDHWCERAVLGLVLAILVFSPLAYGSVRLQEFVVVQWLTVAVLLVWGLRFVINPEHRLLWPPMSWAVLAFMGYAVARYWTADIEYVARQEVLRVLVYGFLFFAIVHNLHRQEPTQIISFALVVVAMGMALMALYQFLTNADHIWGAVKPLVYRKRGSGPFINPNHLAGYLEMVLPLALAFTLMGRLGALSKVVLGYASLVIFVGLITTVSRGGWTATVLSLGVFMVWLMRQRGYRIQALAITATLVLLGSGFLFKAQFSPKRREMLDPAVSTEDVRFQLWKPAWAVWREQPWWGVGPGHFDAHYFRHRQATFDLQFRPERVHNDYLNTLVDWGVIGAALVLAAWALFYTDVFRGWKYVQRAPNDLGPRRSNRAALVMGGSLGLLAILAHSWVDFNMHIPANAILATTLLALVAGHFRFATERYWHTVRWPLQVPVYGVLLAGVAALSWGAWRATGESYWLSVAKRVKTAADRRAALERAFTVEPRNAQTALQIGELLREQSFRGEPGYEELARAAVPWFQRAASLNPFDPVIQVRLGMCLDWLGQHEEAWRAFARALELDPNGYFTLAHVGWHYAQVGDYATAEQWLEKSYRLYGNNPVARNYLQIVRERLAEQQRPKEQ